jgi:hypothetical protein
LPETRIILPFPAWKGDNHLVRHLISIAIVSAVFATSAGAVREFVVLEEPLPAQLVEGTVLDPGGAPIPDMTVSDCTPQWAAVLRSTKTDSKGHFRLSRQHGKIVYYLRFDHRLFNPLGLRLTLDKNAPQRGITARPHIGG